MSLSSHPEFKKGNVHTNFIPDHMSGLFPKKYYSMENIATIVLAQLFSEQANNLRKVLNKDPFAVEGPFRLNHSLSRILNYSFSEKLTARVKVVPVEHAKNTWNVEYIIKNAATGEIDENKFVLSGSYVEGKDDLIIECKVNNKVRKFCFSLLIKRKQNKYSNLFFKKKKKTINYRF